MTKLNNLTVLEKLILERKLTDVVLKYIKLLDYQKDKVKQAQIQTQYLEVIKITEYKEKFKALTSLIEDFSQHIDNGLESDNEKYVVKKLEHPRFEVNLVEMRKVYKRTLRMLKENQLN